jgi:hypothetical protein
VAWFIVERYRGGRDGTRRRRQLRRRAAWVRQAERHRWRWVGKGGKEGEKEREGRERWFVWRLSWGLCGVWQEVTRFSSAEQKITLCRTCTAIFLFAGSKRTS